MTKCELVHGVATDADPTADTNAAVQGSSVEAGVELAAVIRASPRR